MAARRIPCGRSSAEAKETVTTAAARMKEFRRAREYAESARAEVEARLRPASIYTLQACDGGK